MIDRKILDEQLNFMLEKQVQHEEDYGYLMPWNKGYKAAIEDVIYFLEQNND